MPANSPQSTLLFPRPEAHHYGCRYRLSLLWPSLKVASPNRTIPLSAETSNVDNSKNMGGAKQIAETVTVDLHRI
jgi:hypothetical protein